MTLTQTPKPVEPFLTHRETILGTYVLYILGVVSGPIGPIIGLMFAYDERKEAGTLAASHFKYQIRAFWWATSLILGGFVFLAFGTLAYEVAETATIPMGGTWVWTCIAIGLIGAVAVIAGHILLLVKAITGMIALNRKLPAR